jgi:hypothetical protein
MDALIAVQFFGYRWRVSSHSGRRCVYPPDAFPTWMDTLATGDEPLVADWHPGWARWMPAYSTDIAAAWAVVEKMREAGWRYCLIGYVSSPLQECVFERKLGHDGDRFSASADTMPLAICRASLLSLEEHQSDG